MQAKELIILKNLLATYTVNELYDKNNIDRILKNITCGGYNCELCNNMLNNVCIENIPS